MLEPIFNFFLCKHGKTNIEKPSVLYLIDIFVRITVDFRHCYLFYRFLLDGEISEKVTISRKFKERVVQPILKVKWSTTVAVFKSYIFSYYYFEKVLSLNLVVESVFFRLVA